MQLNVLSPIAALLHMPAAGVKGSITASRACTLAATTAPRNVSTTTTVAHAARGIRIGTRRPFISTQATASGPTMAGTAAATARAATISPACISSYACRDNRKNQHQAGSRTLWYK